MRRNPLLLAATLVTLLSFTVAQAATVSDINPRRARLDAATDFTVTGTGLGQVSIENCATTASSYSGNATTASFQCKPTLSGTLRVLVDGVPSGHTVVADHPTRQGNPAARGIPSVGGVSLFNGNFFYQATDMAVPGKGPAFTLTRSYNSYSWPEEAKRGGVNECRPWRFNWEVSVGWVPAAAGRPAKSQIYVELADGSGLSFFKHSDGRWYPMDQGSFEKLEVSATTVVLRSRSGLSYTFEAPDVNGGRLRSVMDPHNQGLTLSYGANGKLSTVLDSNALPYRFAYDTAQRLIKVDNLGRGTDLLSVEFGWERDTVAGAPQECVAGQPQHGYRDRLAWVKDFRGKTTRFDYAASLPKTLVRITDPSNRPVVQLTYDRNVYGNTGVSSVKNGVGDTWLFSFCADSANSLNDPPATCIDTTRAKRFRTTVKPPLGPDRLALFDVAGRPAGGIDGNGRLSTALSTDTTSNGLPLDPTQYNRAGLPSERRTPLALARPLPTASFRHDAAGLLELLKDAKGHEHRTAWANGNGTPAGDAARNLRCATDRTSPEGLVSRVLRDSVCRVMETASPGSPASKLAYGALEGLPSKPVEVTDPRNNKTVLRYERTGFLKGTTGPEGEITATAYDRIGRVKTQTNPLLGVTTYTYDGASSLVTQVTDPLNRITRSSYDDSGNLKQRIAPNGRVTDYTYDATNRLVRTTTTVTTATGPQVVSTQTVYDALGRVKQVINANNHASTTTFDDAGNALARANALGQATSYEYDADNRVTKVTDAAGRVTETIYDELGRVTSVTTPAGSQGYDYDRDGRVVRHVDARNLATQYFYDPSTGHLVKVIDAAGKPTTAAYDPAGNNRSITDPNGNTTWFEYDKSNRRTKRTDPNGDVWTWEYDKAGNVRYARAPGGLVVESIYDVAGQLKEQRRQPENQVVRFDYDPNGNRKTMTDATGVTQYDYDGINRLTQVTDPRGKVLKFAYDAAGNRTAITYPHNKVVGYAYDAAERLVSVSDWLGRTHRYTLNAAGQVTQLELANGTRETRTYDAASRLTSLVNSGPGNAVISSHMLQMDPNGNIVEAAVQLPLLPSFGPGTKTMTYDVANRLTSVDGQPVTHDSAGRLTSIGTDGYAYDSRDLLTTITGPNAGTNTYNGAGHRVARSNAAGTTRYVIDPSAGNMFSVLQENDGSDNLLRSYVHGYGLLMQISAADVPRYYHFDPTGHTLALTDQSGVFTDKYAYLPFGETTATGTTANPFRWVGKLGVVDEANGLHFMRARFYRARESRFLGLDALEGGMQDLAQANRYQYSFNNPVASVDPTGMKAYVINRELFKLNSSPLSKNSLLSHTFLATTDSNNWILHTYSWGTEDNPNGWMRDNELAVAQTAIQFGLAEELPDVGLEDSIDSIWKLYYAPSEDSSAKGKALDHENWVIAANCKAETFDLLNAARNLKHIIDTGKTESYWTHYKRYLKYRLGGSFK
jgi:RHS repeat-associated protein